MFSLATLPQSIRRNLWPPSWAWLHGTRRRRVYTWFLSYKRRLVAAVLQHPAIAAEVTDREQRAASRGYSAGVKDQKAVYRTTAGSTGILASAVHLLMQEQQRKHVDVPRDMKNMGVGVYGIRVEELHERGVVRVSIDG